MTLIEHMVQQKVSYRALAAELGVHHTYLHRVAHGKRKATLALALRVQELTGGAVMPGDLIAGQTRPLQAMAA